MQTLKDYAIRLSLEAKPLLTDVDTFKKNLSGIFDSLKATFGITEAQIKAHTTIINQALTNLQNQETAKAADALHNLTTNLDQKLKAGKNYSDAALKAGADFLKQSEDQVKQSTERVEKLESQKSKPNKALADAQKGAEKNRGMFVTSASELSKDSPIDNRRDLSVALQVKAGVDRDTAERIKKQIRDLSSNEIELINHAEHNIQKILIESHEKQLLEAGKFHVRQLKELKDDEQAQKELMIKFNQETDKMDKDHQSRVLATQLTAANRRKEAPHEEKVGRIGARGEIFKEFGKEKATETASELTGELGAMGGVLTKLGPIGLTFGAALGGIAFAATEAKAAVKEFNENTKKVGSTLTPEQLKNLPEAMDRLREVSTTTGESLSQLQKNFGTAMANSVGLADNMKAGTSLMEKTSKAAVGLQTDTAGLLDKETKLSAAFKLPLTDIENQEFLLNTLANTATSAVNVSLDQMTDILADVGPNFRSLSKDGREALESMTGLASALSVAGFSSGDIKKTMDTLGDVLSSTTKRTQLLKLGLQGIDKETGQVQDWNTVFQSLSKDYSKFESVIANDKVKDTVRDAAREFGKDNGKMLADMLEGAKNVDGKFEDLFGKLQDTAENKAKKFEEVEHEMWLNIGEGMNSAMGGASMNLKVMMSDTMTWFGELFEPAEKKFKKFHEAGEAASQTAGKIGIALEKATNITDANAPHILQMAQDRIKEIAKELPYVADQMKVISEDRDMPITKKAEKLVEYLKDAKTAFDAIATSKSLDAQEQAMNSLEKTFVSTLNSAGKYKLVQETMAKQSGANGDPQAGRLKAVAEDLPKVIELQRAYIKEQENLFNASKGDSNKRIEIAKEIGNAQKDLNVALSIQGKYTKGLEEGISRILETQTESGNITAENANTELVRATLVKEISKAYLTDEETLSANAAIMDKLTKSSETFVKNLKEKEATERKSLENSLALEASASAIKEIKSAKTPTEKTEKIGGLVADQGDLFKNVAGDLGKAESKIAELKKQLEEANLPTQKRLAINKEIHAQEALEKTTVDQIINQEIAKGEYAQEYLGTAIKSLAVGDETVESLRKELSVKLEKIKADEEEKKLAIAKKPFLAESAMLEDAIKQKLELMLGVEANNNQERLKGLDLIRLQNEAQIKQLESIKDKTPEQAAQKDNLEAMNRIISDQTEKLNRQIIMEKSLGLAAKDIIQASQARLAQSQSEIDGQQKILEIKKMSGQLSDTDYESQSFQLTKDKLANETAYLNILKQSKASKTEILTQESKVLDSQKAVLQAQKDSVQKANDLRRTSIDLQSNYLELQKESGAISEEEYSHKKIDFIRQKIALESQVLQTMRSQGASRIELLQQEQKIVGLQIEAAKALKEEQMKILDLQMRLVALKESEYNILKAMGMTSELDDANSAIQLGTERLGIEEDILNTLMAQGATQAQILDQQQKVNQARSTIAAAQFSKVKMAQAEKEVEVNFQVDKFQKNMDSFLEVSEKATAQYYEELDTRKQYFEREVDFNKKENLERLGWLRQREGLTTSFMDKLSGIVKSLKSITLGERFNEIDDELARAVQEFKKDNLQKLAELDEERKALAAKMGNNAALSKQIEHSEGANVAGKIDTIKSGSLGPDNEIVNAFKRKEIWERLDRLSTDELKKLKSAGDGLVNDYKTQAKDIDKELKGGHVAEINKSSVKNQQTIANANANLVNTQLNSLKKEIERRESLQKTYSKQSEDMKKSTEELSKSMEENRVQTDATTKQMEKYNTFTSAATKVQEVKASLDGLMDSIYELGKASDITTQTYLKALIERFKELDFGTIATLSKDLKNLNVDSVFQQATELTQSEAKIKQLQTKLDSLENDPRVVSSETKRAKLMKDLEEANAEFEKIAKGVDYYTDEQGKKYGYYATNKGSAPYDYYAPEASGFAFKQTQGTEAGQKGAGYGRPIAGPELDKLYSSGMLEKKEQYQETIRAGSFGISLKEQEEKYAMEIAYIKKVTELQDQAETKDAKTYREKVKPHILEYDKLLQDSVNKKNAIQKQLGSVVVVDNKSKIEQTKKELEGAQTAYTDLTQTLSKEEETRQKKLGAMILSIKTVYNIGFDAAVKYLSILPLVEKESDARIGNFRLFTDSLKAAADNTPILDRLKEIDKQLESVTDPEKIAALKKERDELTKPVANPLLAINWDQTLEFMRQGIDLQKQLLLDNKSDSDLTREKIAIYKEQYKEITASLQAQVDLYEDIVKQGKEAHAADLKQKEEKLLGLKKELKAIKDVNELTEEGQKQLQIKADVSTLTKSLDLKKIIYDTDHATNQLELGQTNELVKQIEINKEKLKGLEDIYHVVGLTNQQIAESLTLSDEQKKLILEARKALGESKTSRNEKMVGIDYKSWDDYAKNVSKDMDAVTQAFEEGGDSVAAGIVGLGKIAAGTVTLITDTMKDAGAMVGSFMSGDVKGGLEKSGDLMTKIGTALLNAPAPLDIAGAVLMVGGQIAKIISSFIENQLTELQKLQNSSAERAAAEKLVLSYYEAELNAVKELADLGSTLYDTAQERMDAEEKIYQSMLAQNVEAQKYKDMSIEDLESAKVALEKKKADATKKKSDADITKNQTVNDQEMYILKHGTTAQVQGSQWAYMWKDKEALGKIIDEIASGSEVEAQNAETSEAAIQAILDHKKAQAGYEKDIAAESKTTAEQQIADLEKLNKAVDDYYSRRKSEIEHNYALNIIGEKQYTAQTLQAMQDQYDVLKLRLATQQAIGAETDKQWETINAMWDLDVQIVNLKNKQLEVENRREEHEKKILDYRLHLKEITESQHDTGIADILNQQLKDQEDYVALLESQGAKEEMILDAKDKQMDIEMQIYDLKHKTNGLDAAALDNLKAMNRERNKLVLEAKSGKVVDPAKIAALEASIISTMKSAGASQDQINRQLQTFRATLPKFEQGGSTGAGGLTMTHPEEWIFNKPTTAFFQKQFPGFLDNINSASNKDAILSQVRLPDNGQVYYSQIQGSIDRRTANSQTSNQSSMNFNGGINITVIAEKGMDEKALAWQIKKAFETELWAKGIGRSML